MSTIRELLESATARLRASGSESARLDTELLLAWAIPTERTAVLAHPEAPVGADAAARFEEAIARREKGEPVAYIRGLKEFYGLAFSVDARALIPRPETELLVAAAERDVAARLTAGPRPAGTPRLRVVDVGTGAGTIAVSLAVVLRRRRMLSEVDLVATDASPDALDLARENAVAHAVADAIRFMEVDLLPEIVAATAAGPMDPGAGAAGGAAGVTGGPAGAAGGPVGAAGAPAGAAEPPFDLVLANLPYIPSEEVDRLPIAASFEPRSALDGGPDGLDSIRRLLDRLPVALAPEGLALLEIGWDQRRAVEAAVAAMPPVGGWSGWIDEDLGGRPRLLHVERTRDRTGSLATGGAHAGRVR